MNYSNMNNYCSRCARFIPGQVYSFSMDHYELPLCIDCQEDFKMKCQTAAPLAIKLYKELIKRGIPAELEKWDGHKTIDIAVVDAKVNIEVDGEQHYYDSNQAIADLYRTLFAFKRGYLTLRIPNSLIKYDLKRTADLVNEFLMESQNQIGWKEL